MKIVSQFSDYYDHIAETYYSPGTPKIEFHRKTSQCNLTQIYCIRDKFLQKKADSIRLFSDKKDNWSIVFFTIGFCGKLYQGAQILLSNVTEVSYTLTGAKYLPRKHDIYLSSEIEENAEKHFNQSDDIYHNVCKEIDEPLFIILPGSFQNIQIIKNPVLSEWQFHKSESSYNAFHKIKMFLLKQSQIKSKKRDSQSNLWHLNPLLSMFLTAN